MKVTSEDYIGKTAPDWQIAFDAIKDPIMFLNNEFRIVAFNKGFVSFLK